MFKGALTAAFLFVFIGAASARPATQADIDWIQQEINGSVPNFAADCESYGYKDDALVQCVRSYMHRLGNSMQSSWDVDFTPEIWAMFDDAVDTYASSNSQARAQHIGGKMIEGAFKGLMLGGLLYAVAWVRRRARRESGDTPKKFSNKPSIAEETPEDDKEPAALRAPVSRKIAGLPDFVPVVADSPKAAKGRQNSPTVILPKRTRLRDNVTPESCLIPTRKEVVIALGIVWALGAMYNLSGLHDPRQTSSLGPQDRR